MPITSSPKGVVEALAFAFPFGFAFASPFSAAKASRGPAFTVKDHQHAAGMYMLPPGLTITNVDCWTTSAPVGVARNCS
eukprot:6061568-Pyramimonas_sp.AAC.1